MQDADVKAALAKEWQLTLPEDLSEAQILVMLEARIAILLTGSSEDFFQMMYRLDIDEQKLGAAMREADVPAELAGLVWERQLQRIRSKARYSPPPPDDYELKW